MVGENENIRSSKRKAMPNLRYKDNEGDSKNEVSKIPRKTKQLSTNDSAVIKPAKLKQATKTSPKDKGEQKNPEHSIIEKSVEITENPSEMNRNELTEQAIPTASKIDLGGRICRRQDLRPKLKKKGLLRYEVDCSEMAMSNLDANKMNVAELKNYIQKNMKVDGKLININGDIVTVQQLDWKLIVMCNTDNVEKHPDKAYIKYLIKNFLRKMHLQDWIHVDAKAKGSLKLKYFRM